MCSLIGLDVWLSSSAPENVLSGIAPECGTTVRSARAYLSGRGAEAGGGERSQTTRAFMRYDRDDTPDLIGQ